ncbi:MAG: tetratricopeptide repeat protein [Bacteroidales bacterium]
MPNKISRFWQELKRRNVFRVVTVYTGAAFVILSLVDMIREPFELPNWGFKLVIVLLSVGLIIAVILSWIYDIHPEGRIVKTEPADQRNKGDVPKTSNGWKIASYISFVVIVGLIVLNVFPRVKGGKRDANPDRSIAVMPFTNDSPGPDSEYVINGYMASIHDMLCRIQDLRVLARNSTEQYRNNPKPYGEIARELHVGYLLTASGQIYKNKIRLIVQLEDADENILWSHPYDRPINDVDDHVAIQSEIARLVADKLQATITSDEEKRMNRPPTSNLTAYNLYLKANEYESKYNQTHDLVDYQTAVNLYELALETDPKFARAYTGLARAYYHRDYWPEYFTENFLDSCLLMVNKALSIDDQLDEAYFLRGEYYRQNGDLDSALASYDQAIRINPNFYEAFRAKGTLYAWESSEILQGLENLYKAMSLASIEDRPELLRSFGGTLSGLGFFDQARRYFKEAVAIDENGAVDTWRNVSIEFNQQHYEEALRLAREAYSLDTNRLINLHFFIYTHPEHIEEAYAHAQKVIEKSERTGVPIYFQSHRIGYIYYQMGMMAEADKFFNQQIFYSEESIKLKRPYSNWKHAPYDLSATYAFIGDKDRAYQLLDELNALNYFDLALISFIEGDPLYASIREEDRFQNILRDMKAKNQAEHERVALWLEENDLL